MEWAWGVVVAVMVDAAKRVDGSAVGVTLAGESRPQLVPRQGHLVASLSTPYGRHVATSPSQETRRSNNISAPWITARPVSRSYEGDNGGCISVHEELPDKTLGCMLRVTYSPSTYSYIVRVVLLLHFLYFSITVQQEVAVHRL